MQAGSLLHNNNGGMQAGHQLHSNNVLIMAQGTMPGSSRLNPHVAEKVNERARSARLPTRGFHCVNPILADKVTGNVPFLSPRTEPGSLNWLKCQHVEGTPLVNTPHTLMEPQPTGTPYATLNVSHCPSSQRPMSPRPTGGYPVTGKLNEAPCQATSRSVCQSQRGDGLTVKITDQSRDGRPPKARQKSAPPLHKITEPSRERGGWTHHQVVTLVTPAAEV